MASVRTRLTVAYAAALATTMGLFSMLLYSSRSETSQEPARRLLLAQADLVSRVLRQAAREGPTITFAADSAAGDSVFRQLRPQLRDDVRERIDVLPHYVVVLDATGRRVYSSPALNRIVPPVPDSTATPEQRTAFNQAYAQYQDVLDAARRINPLSETAKLMVAGDSVMLVGRFVPLPDMPVATVAAAMPISAFTGRAERELLRAVLVVAPVLLLFSAAVAYLIAGRAFVPMDRLTSDLEAISDGRSLHRRLPVDDSGDEIARLTVTLNAMLGRLESYFGALRRFTADASHELKTPLAVLRADVERAMSASTMPSERLVALEEALHETTRMADLVDQLLTLARADEGRFDLHREPVELAPLVRDVYETALILGESSGLTVTMPACEEGTVMGDRTRLRQLFLNLVTNAIKYTPRGGEVEVTLRRAGDVATLSVRDTGIGIAAADLPYIFDRFWRADRVRSRSSERGGFGLGLAISQWIAQAHGGTLTASSRLTRGSVFTVTLPLAPITTAEYAIVPAARAARSV